MKTTLKDSSSAAATASAGMLGQISPGDSLSDADKFQDIFEHATVGIFRTTPEGRFLRVNPTLARLLGYSAADLIGDTAPKLYVDPCRRAEFARLVDANNAVMNFESQIYRRCGDVIWISENAWAVRDAQGAVKFFEGFVEDVTERKRREESERQRGAASEAHGRLMLDISHEFRAPLDGVIGMLELLDGTELSPQQRQYVTDARLSADRLLGLIQHVANLSEQEAPGALRRPSPAAQSKREYRPLVERDVFVTQPSDPTVWLDNVDALLAGNPSPPQR
jgi:PAS domain S-box-containing protein